MDGPVLYEVDQHIATITLNRPHRRNAWTGRMHNDYRRMLAGAEADPGVRAIIVTGSGDGFCVGGDMAALEGHVDKGGYDSGLPDEVVTPGTGVRSEFEADFAYHFALTKPVLAAINGPAAGVGLVLACYADFRFCVPEAKLTTAHGRVGLPAEYGLSWLLPRLIGLSRANELLFTSRVFLGSEAHELGLVHKVAEPEWLLDEARQFMSELIASNSREALAATKLQVYSDLHRDVRTAVEHAQELLDSLTTTESFAYGVDSLVNRRAPRFDLLD